MDTLPLEDQIAALDGGRAYLEHSDVTLTIVSGADARSWLHDLVTADVATLEPFQTRPSLLLSPTGRIRAEFRIDLPRPRDLNSVDLAKKSTEIRLALKDPLKPEGERV